MNITGRLISCAHSEISRKRDYVFKQTKVGNKVQYFSYKLSYLFFDIVALSYEVHYDTMYYSDVAGYSSSDVTSGASLKASIVSFSSCLQVVVALIMVWDGLPVCCDVY